MKSKLLLITPAIVILVTVILVYTKDPIKNPDNNDDKELGKFTLNPITECIVCQEGKTWDNKPCCTNSFDSECKTKNGVIRTTDLHPVLNSTLKGCFQKAPDTGKACAEGRDCLSGVCSLESAIQSNKCNLTKKELTGEKSRYNDVEFYIATYSCNDATPGVCTETIEDELNPGGVSHTFIMEGSKLVETLSSGPIR